MYPLNLIKPTKDHTREAAGFAVANDADEHQRLSEQGYEPAFEAEEGAEPAPRKPGRPKKAE